MKQMISVKQVLFVLAFLSLAACGSGGGGNDAGPGGQKPQGTYRSEPAGGMINGGNWVFLSGVAVPQFNDTSRMSLRLYGEAYADPCSGFNFGKESVLTSVRAAVGETILGQMPNIETATFAYTEADGGNANMIATDGRIAVTEITAEEVSGFIIARYDGVNFVNGSFKVKVCQH